MNYNERLFALRDLKEGDRWFNIKTGRWAEFVGRQGPWKLVIKHESGRESVKQTHYFASDFTPEKPE